MTLTRTFVRDGAPLGSARVRQLFNSQPSSSANKAVPLVEQSRSAPVERLIECRDKLSGVRVVVVSDTHSPRFWKRCPPAVADRLVGADLILHAGDVCTPQVLDELSAFAPVRVVLGNNDGPEIAAWGAPETLELDLDGLKIAMIHNAGPSDGRLARMHRRFPAAELVIFGHSHIPLDVADDNLRILNPGSPTDKRRQPHRTLAELTITQGQLEAARILDLP